MPSAQAHAGDAPNAALGTVYVQAAVAKVNLGPAHGAKLSCPQAVPVGQQDCRNIPGAVPASLAGSIYQALYLRLSQVLPWPIGGIG